MGSQVIFCTGLRISAKAYSVFMSLAFGFFFGGILVVLLTDVLPAIPNNEIWTLTFGILVAFLALGIVGIFVRCEWLLIPAMMISILITALALLTALMFFSFCFYLQSGFLEYLLQDYFDIHSVIEDSTMGIGLRMLCCLVAICLAFWATVPFQFFIALLKSFKNMHYDRVHADIPAFVPSEKSIAKAEIQHCV